MRTRSKVALAGSVGFLILLISIVVVVAYPALFNAVALLMLGGASAVCASIALLLRREQRQTLRKVEAVERALRKLEERQDEAKTDRARVDLRIDRSLDSVDGHLDSISRTLRAGPGGLRHQLRHEVSRDVAAHLALNAMAPTTGIPVPLTSYSALPWTVLQLVQEIINTSSDALVVELGSGTSTLWMAVAAKRASKSVRIISVDHSAEWADHTRRALAANGVEDLVELRVAPLVPLTEGGGDWYDPALLHDVDDIALLFIDGPPGSTSKRARMPAVEMLADRMALECVVVIDDTNRPDEKASVEAWRGALGSQGVLNTLELERTVIIERTARPTQDLRR